MSILAVPLVLLACADASSLATGDIPPADTGERSTDAATDTGGGAADSGIPLDPQHWLVQGTLVVGTDESLDVAASALELALVDASAGAIACATPLDLAGALPRVDAPDTDATWLGWTGLVPGTPTCGESPVASLALGLGPLPVEVRARLGDVGLDAAADALYGAWVQVPGGLPATYGVAGTDTAYGGAGLATTPVPTGAYAVQAVYLFAR